MRIIPILSIAGSDSCGGAGIQADIKTVSALGCYASTAITAITVQDTAGVGEVVPVAAEVVGRQVRAVMADLRPQAVKIGMLATADIVLAVSDALRSFPRVPVVVDPVVRSSSGQQLLDDDGIRALCNQLFPLATLVTPNIPETERLAGITIRQADDCAIAARAIMQCGAGAVLIKGGHLPGPEKPDLLLRRTPAGTDCQRYSANTIATRNTHGTGCTLSSAIAAYLGRGLSLPAAVGAAKDYTTAAIRAAQDIDIGSGHGPLCHTFSPTPLIKLP